MLKKEKKAHLKYPEIFSGAWVRVSIIQDGVVIYSIPAAVTAGLWNATWVFFPGHAPASGTYTLEVTAADRAGNESRLSQPIQVDLVPED